MSSENFDKIFREKLGGIKPEYHHSVWNRIQAKMPVSPFYLGLKRAAPWAYGTVTTFMLFWMAFQMQDLKTETHRLKDSVRHTEEVLQQSKLALDEIRRRKPDTVYLASTFESDQNLQALPSNGAYNQNALSGISAAAENSASRRNSTYHRNHSSHHTGITASNRSAGTSSAKSGVSQPVVAVSGNQHQPVLPSIPADQRTAPNQNLAATSETESTSVLKETVSATSDSVLQTNNNPLAPKSETAKVDSTVQKKETTEKTKAKNSFRFSDLNARIGLGVTMAAPSYIGFGPDFEIRLSQNLGLSVGLTAYSSIKKEFDTQEDFNTATGYVFHTAYKNSVSPNENGIHDITIETSNIEVPVRLKYYAPVSESYNLIFSAGTHFNISNRDKVRYEVIDYNREEFRTFTNNSQSNVFHNFILGFGLERKGSKVNWQLLPYYTYNFRQQGIFEDKKVFGLTLTAWLPLSQK